MREARAVPRECGRMREARAVPRECGRMREARAVPRECGRMREARAVPRECGRMREARAVPRECGRMREARAVPREWSRVVVAVGPSLPPRPISPFPSQQHNTDQNTFCSSIRPSPAAERRESSHQSSPSLSLAAALLASGLNTNWGFCEGSAPLLYGWAPTAYAIRRTLPTNSSSHTFAFLCRPPHFPQSFRSEAPGKQALEIERMKK
ncbi:hypothetical protein niasHT_013625 [Heterodera trifolii]|uniref:Uncharacterized protein n=1 Tax=Heterodera trifolii TaxID=157864 RepID=A0ABD2L2B8_9BILA